MVERRKAQGRALSALRAGLRQARDELLAAGQREAAHDCQRALERAQRMEDEATADQGVAVA